MKKLKCGICGSQRWEHDCHIIVLTDEEKKALRAGSRGTDPPDQCVYCKPCWRTLSNPATGPALMKGILQVGLHQAGVPNSEAVAQKYHTRLAEKVPPKRS